MAKPRTQQAMQQLIAQIRQSLPFDSPYSSLCVGPCEGCSKKLLEYLDDELNQWQLRLENGECPKLGDLHRLARQSKKIYRVLQKNGWLENFQQTTKVNS